MIPSTLVGLVLFAAGIGPGYVYIRIAELRQPRQERSPLFEAAELIFIGAIASTVAVLLAFALAKAGGFVDAQSLIRSARAYAPNHPLRVLTLVLIVLCLSYGGTAIVAFLAHRGSPPSIKPGYSAWHFLLAEKPGEYRPYATVELRDGRSLAGWVGAYTVEPADPAKRELMLTSPLRVKAPAAPGFVPMRDDGIILQGADILAISVQTHADRRPAPSRFSKIRPRRRAN